jgi:hypothetical protein
LVVNVASLNRIQYLLSFLRQLIGTTITPSNALRSAGKDNKKKESPIVF